MLCLVLQTWYRKIQEKLGGADSDQKEKLGGADSDQKEKLKQ